jgi:hypothetical protein
MSEDTRHGHRAGGGADSRRKRPGERVSSRSHKKSEMEPLIRRKERGTVAENTAPAVPLSVVPPEAFLS